MNFQNNSLHIYALTNKIDSRNVEYIKYKVTILRRYFVNDETGPLILDLLGFFFLQPKFQNMTEGYDFMLMKT